MHRSCRSCRRDIWHCCRLSSQDWHGLPWTMDRPGQTGTDWAKQDHGQRANNPFLFENPIRHKVWHFADFFDSFFAFVRICVSVCVSSVPDVKHSISPGPSCPLISLSGSFNWNSCAVHFNLHFQVLRYQLKSQPYNLLSAQIRGA